MKIFCNNTKNIIMVVAFACVCLVSAGTAEAECYKKQVCDPMFAPCPSGYSVYTNQMLPWPWSPYGWACFPCGGYCWLPGGGHAAGPVCATGPYSGCIDIGPYLIGWSCYDIEICNGECNNSILYGCTVPNSTTAAINKVENPTNWTWNCPGKGPGGLNSPTCTLYKPTCGPHHLSPCTYGTSSTVNDLNNRWEWTCKEDSLTVPCQESNCAPNICVGQTCTNPSGVVPGTKQPDLQEICSQATAIDCAPEDCESTIPYIPYICTLHDNNGCSPDASCDASTKCPAPLTQTCRACPRNAGGWKEVSP